MKPGDVRINLKNLDGQDIGEHIVTDGVRHMLYSPYLDGPKKIDRGRLTVILRDHAGMTLADLAVVLLA